MTNNIKININDLQLDLENPRLSEYGITQTTPEKEILTILWDEMDLSELVYSIVSNGFWDYEPLIAIKNTGKKLDETYTVIEGNRRLAAVKIIHNQKLIEKSIPSSIKSKINETLLKQTLELPIIKVSSREESWKYIGFKHVNGPSKWGSYAKAKYLAEIHNNYNIPLPTIAIQIGDTNQTVQKLYQGLMVLEQAKKNKLYDYKSDLFNKRIYFSHIYTGLQRDGIRTYLNIKNASEEDPDPVPENKYEELRELLTWMYGDKKNDIPPLIKSQNPDLKYLDESLKKRESTLSLKNGDSLEQAYELSRSSGALFEENLIKAKNALLKARSYLTDGYKGDDMSLVKLAGSIANNADDLYTEMENKYNKLNNRKKPRLSED